ncbi:MAG: HD-GYP domain-containing protein [Deltaproteobacteria bacterium]|nr:HD-GYP domain-containing protein [Deltaproteobacteria bacterium]
MIKKVKVEKLRPGIFVHDFNTDWNSGNLLTNQTLIRDVKIIDILHSWGIKEVYIDTDKGFDVSDAKPALEARLDTDSALREMAREKPAAASNFPLKEEILLAKKIKKQAVNVIMKAMETVREGKPLETENAYQLIVQMEKSIARNRDALVLLTRIRRKDEYTLMHSISVGAYIINFCNFFKLPLKRTLSLAIGALFHDIGKTRIPLAILNKPGKLDDKEFAEMKRHSLYSAEILQNARNLPREAFDMGLHHHERYDGTGYPDGLLGEAIKSGSQLVAIADVYDAITSDRCYRNGMDRVEGLRKLYEWCEYHFNKDLTHKFIRSIGVYPIGTCVRLESGRIGVVVGSTESMAQPVVRIFFDDEKKSAVAGHDLDLSKTDDQVVGYEESDKWDIKGMNIFEEITADLFAG